MLKMIKIQKVKSLLDLVKKLKNKQTLRKIYYLTI
ncbi:hypothetical protein ACS2LE_000570 [Campylobacter jejuni]